jgi:hypothetical protein
MSLGMQEILPDGGLASFQDHVSRIADLGRYEDAYIVHAAEGETVVPMAVFDENPRLKMMLFAQMRDMGIDPERYIVGNELNSINPVTGQPEFFLKQIFKSAKKALKTIAPYAGTIAGLAGLGPMGSAIVGAGVPLLMGEDMSTAIAGGLGGYGAGTAFGSRFGADPNYVFKGGLEGSLGRMKKNLGFGQTAGSQKLDAETATQLGLGENATWAEVAKDEALRKRHDWLMNKGILQNPASASWEPFAKTAAAFAPLAVSGKDEDEGGKPEWWDDDIYGSWWGASFAPAPITSADGGIINAYDRGGPVDMPYDPEGYPHQKYKPDYDTFTGLAEREDAIPALMSTGLQDKFDKVGLQKFVDPDPDFDPADYKEGYLMLMQNLHPDTDREIHEQEYDNWFTWADPTTEEYQNRKNRLLKLLSNLPGGGAGYESAYDINPDLLPPDQMMSPRPDFEKFEQDTQDKYQYTQDKYADGGIAHLAGGSFPRMTGAISGPGGPRDDMVPAMLSDGEFVMTAEAVRNAGGGDRREGARRMYQLMNQLQGVA